MDKRWKLRKLTTCNSIHGPTPPSCSDTAPNINNTITDSSELRGLPIEKSPGYLGFTSASAVFQETQNCLSLVHGSPAIPSTQSPSPSTSPATTTLTPQALEISLVVLSHLPPAQVTLALFLKDEAPNYGWIRLAAQRTLESLHGAFAPELHAGDLPAMAQVIATNTARPWTEENEPDADRWLASLCGRNLRWEMLGSLLIFLASAALGDDRGHSRKSAIVYKEAAQACVVLCRGTKQNSLLLNLMLQISILESILSGDSSPSFWKNWYEMLPFWMI